MGLSIIPGVAVIWKTRATKRVVSVQKSSNGATHRRATTIRRSEGAERPHPPYLRGMEQPLSTPAPIVNTSVKLAIGIFFAVLGVVLTLDNLNLFDPYPYLRYWSVIFIVVGALKIGDVTSRGLAIASIITGVVLLSWTTRWLRFSIFDLWPLVLIVAGVMIVLQATGVR